MSEQKFKTFGQGQMKKALEKKLINAQIAGTSDEFHGWTETHVGLWLSGEEGNLFDGLEAFNYWAESDLWDGGVLKGMRDWLDDRGWWAEWNDAGTIMLYKK